MVAHNLIVVCCVFHGCFEFVTGSSKIHDPPRELILHMVPIFPGACHQCFHSCKTLLQLPCSRSLPFWKQFKRVANALDIVAQRCDDVGHFCNWSYIIREAGGTETLNGLNRGAKQGGQNRLSCLELVLTPPAEAREHSEKMPSLCTISMAPKTGAGVGLCCACNLSVTTVLKFVAACARLSCRILSMTRTTSDHLYVEIFVLVFEFSVLLLEKRR